MSKIKENKTMATDENNDDHHKQIIEDIRLKGQIIILMHFNKEFGYNCELL